MVRVPEAVIQGEGFKVALCVPYAVHKRALVRCLTSLDERGFEWLGVEFGEQ
jgi:hypothetical protein